MEKTRVKFDTHLSNQPNAYRESTHTPVFISRSIGMAHAVLGAVVLLIKSAPINPLAHIRF